MTIATSPTAVPPAPRAFGGRIPPLRSPGTGPRHILTPKSPRLGKRRTPKLRSPRVDGPPRFPVKAIEVLQSWIDKHSVQEYPSKQEKQRLAEESDLSVKQVSTWFSNARNKHANPLENWLASSSEDEGASEAAIKKAVQQLNSQGLGYAASNTELTSLPDAQRYPQASPAGSACSAFSQCGEAVMSGPPRRGRKKFISPAPSLSGQRRSSQSSLPACPDGSLPTPPSSFNISCSPFYNPSKEFPLIHGEPERSSTLHTASSSQNQHQYLTLETSGGTVLVPVDVLAASQQADGKRKRNAGASARFRARRKEKEHEAEMAVATLKQELAQVKEELAQAKRNLAHAREDSDHYQRERNFFAETVKLVPDLEAYCLGRSQSLRLTRMQNDVIQTKSLELQLCEIESGADAKRHRRRRTNYVPETRRSGRDEVSERINEVETNESDRIICRATTVQLDRPTEAAGSTPPFIEESCAHKPNLQSAEWMAFLSPSTMAEIPPSSHMEPVWDNQGISAHLLPDRETTTPAINDTLPSSALASAPSINEAEDTPLPSSLDVGPQGISAICPSAAPVGEKRYCPYPDQVTFVKRAVLDHTSISSDTALLLPDPQFSMLSTKGSFESLETPLLPEWYSKEKQDSLNDYFNLMNRIDGSSVDNIDTTDHSYASRSNMPLQSQSLQTCTSTPLELDFPFATLAQCYRAIAGNCEEKYCEEYVPMLDRPHIETGIAHGLPTFLPSIDVNKVPRTKEDDAAVHGVGALKPSIQFQCTFCHKELTSGSWRRHEESVHLPRFHWVCQATGSTISSPDRDGYCCVFCKLANPSTDHFSTCHRSVECSEKPPLERTFTRKDHLKQHWQTFHHCELDADTAQRWRIEADYTKREWTCGFCGLLLENWDIRTRHIAHHFRQGLTMDSWDSNRSLDVASVEMNGDI